MPVFLRRAYEPPTRNDGARYLIDRLWPRGRSAEQLRLTAWLKEIAPSNSLRAWFSHDPLRYPEFRSRYRKELEMQRPLLQRLARESRRGPVTLVFGARDPEHCNATVLREVLNGRGTALRRTTRGPSSPRGARPSSGGRVR